jgi:hypothetical protein
MAHHPPSSTSTGPIVEPGLRSTAGGQHRPGNGNRPQDVATKWSAFKSDVAIGFEVAIVVPVAITLEGDQAVAQSLPDAPHVPTRWLGAEAIALHVEAVAVHRDLGDAHAPYGGEVDLWTGTVRSWPQEGLPPERAGTRPVVVTERPPCLWSGHSVPRCLLA